jgi:hypothetical protein
LQWARVESGYAEEASAVYILYFFKKNIERLIQSALDINRGFGLNGLVSYLRYLVWLPAI